MGGDGKGGGSIKSYYGTIGGVVCAGPVDELVSLIVDGATVWPTNKHWADGIVEVPVLWVQRYSNNQARAGFATPHGLKQGQKVVLTGLPDASFDCSSPTAIIACNDISFRYANPGPAVAQTYVAAGTLTKSVHYGVGNLVGYAGSIWRAIADHWGTLETAPPDATKWEEYVVTRAGNTNPFAFTVPGYGQAYFYWGTADQVLDAVGEQTLSRAGHPPYRRQAVLVLKKFLFGMSREAAPNAEVVVRKKPAQTLIAGAAADLDSDGQANPLAGASELLGDPVFGLGQSEALYDATSWQATADALAAVPEKAYISPKLDEPKTAREFMAGLLAYYDGWMRWNTHGRLEAGRFLHNEAPPAFTAATTIEYHDLVQEIEWDAEGWAGTFNATAVKFQDRLRAFKDAAREYQSGYNLAVVGEPRRATLERPFITRELQALGHAAEYGKINAQPNLSGSLVVRAEKAAAIAAGDLFCLTHDDLAFSVVSRCTEKTITKAPVGTATLKFSNERGVAPIPYHATVAEPGGTMLPPAERISLHQFLQPPPALVSSSDFQLAVLAARTSSMTRGLKPWLQVDDADEFYQLGEQHGWAIKGVLTQGYAANLPAVGTSPPDDGTETLQLELDENTVAADLENVSAPQSADAVNDNALLVFVFGAADPTQFEVMTLKSIRLDSGVYKLTVRRARFGTAQKAFLVGDSAWIIYRTDLVSYTHAKFATYAQAGTPATFRLQAFTATEEADLANADVCPDLAYTFVDPYAPVVSWTSLQKNGVEIADFTAAALTTDTFTFALQITDANGDLSEAKLVARLGATELLLWGASFPLSAVQLKTTSFKLPTEGVWSVFCVAKDLSGRVKEYELRPVGGGDPVQLIIQAAANPAVATPTSNKASGGYVVWNIGVSLSCVTSGASISYSLVPYGNAPGSWTSYTTAVNVSLTSGDKTLYAKATKTGMPDSAVVRWDYWYEGSGGN